MCHQLLWRILYAPSSSINIIGRVYCDIGSETNIGLSFSFMTYMFHFIGGVNVLELCYDKNQMYAWHAAIAQSILFNINTYLL